MKRVRFQQGEPTMIMAADSGKLLPCESKKDGDGPRPLEEIQNKATTTEPRQSSFKERKSAKVPAIPRPIKTKTVDKPLLPESVLSVPSTKHYSRSSDLFQCSVVIERNTGRLYLYYRHDPSKTPVLRADKRQTSKVFPKYYVYDTSNMARRDCNLQLGKESEQYLGKLRRDDKDCSIHAFSLHPKRDTVRSKQSLYMLYSYNHDNGDADALASDSNCRSQDNAAVVESVPPSPRNMQVALYHKDGDSRNHMNTLADRVSSSLKESRSLKHVAEPISGLYTFSNKLPYKNKEGQWTLNFSNRCRKGSQANTQLQDENGRVILQLAQWDCNRYNLDFRTPFHAFQAFGFAIAQLCDY